MILCWQGCARADVCPVLQMGSMMGFPTCACMLFRGPTQQICHHPTTCRGAGAEAVVCTSTCVADPEPFLHRRGVRSSRGLSQLCCAWLSERDKRVLRAWRGVWLSDVLEKGMS